MPVGAFLSGGVDSSSVVALMQTVSDRPAKTFTVDFQEAGYSSPVMKSRFDQSVSGATMMMITSMAGLPSMFATMAIARAASN